MLYRVINRCTSILFLLCLILLGMNAHAVQAVTSSDQLSAAQSSPKSITAQNTDALAKSNTSQSSQQFIAEAASTGSSNTLFYRANSLYEGGKYQEAVDAYEQILQNGQASGNLYYNLGNAYYRLGEKGLALVNYRRAKALIPRDPDLRSNLAYLENDLKISKEGEGFTASLTTVLNDLASTREFIFWAEIFLTLTVVLLIIWIVLPHYKKLVQIPLLTTALCLVLLLSASGASLLGHNKNQAIVIKSETQARFEPSETGGVYYTLREGASVMLDTTREGWALIKRSDGKKGWVPKEDIRTLQIQRAVVSR